MSTALQPQQTDTPPRDKQIEAITQIICQRTPEKEIRKFKGRGGRVFSYTDPAYVIRTLNEAFGHNWDFEADSEQIIEWQGVPFEVRCRGRLTVRLAGQSVTKVQYGSQAIEFIKDKQGNIVAPVTIGDAFKGAASDAMKKCASLLGIALDLYDSDFKAENYADDDEDVDREAGAGLGSRAYRQDTSDPRPKTLGELATPKQLWMIRSMAKEIGVDVEKECLAQFNNCPLEQINRRAASILIDYLKNKGGSDPDANQVEEKPGQPPAPSRKGVFNRKHSKEAGDRLDAACRRLITQKISGETMLSEVNEYLASRGKPVVGTRYDLDDESALSTAELFEKWASALERKAQAGA